MDLSPAQNSFGMTTHMDNDQANEFNEKMRRIKEELIPFYQRYIVPILILPSKSSCNLQEVLTSGTGFLLKLGPKYILVTCSHVWEKYCQVIQKTPNAIIGATTGEYKMLNLSKMLPIANSREKDIAILDVSEHVRNEKLGSKSFYIPSQWPPKRPKENDIVFVLGYPGMLRQPIEGNINLVLFLDFVRNVSENSSTLRDENNQRRIIQYNDSLQELNDLGGFSGAPAFAQYEGEWTFVGIMYEGAYKVCDTTVGIISISHADFISSSAEIRL